MMEQPRTLLLEIQTHVAVITMINMYNIYENMITTVEINKIHIYYIYNTKPK